MFCNTVLLNRYPLVMKCTIFYCFTAVHEHLLHI
uniref:Fusolin n=1 Tax=Aster yellows phytoplasma TaxID=35779 RepID=Q849B7_ASTYP|nr:fusolin [Aster yellows phytoplasma]